MCRVMYLSDWIFYLGRGGMGRWRLWSKPKEQEQTLLIVRMTDLDAFAEGRNYQMIYSSCPTSFLLMVLGGMQSGTHQNHQWLPDSNRYGTGGGDSSSSSISPFSFPPFWHTRQTAHLPAHEVMAPAPLHALCQLAQLRWWQLPFPPLLPPYCPQRSPFTLSAQEQIMFLSLGEI